MIRKLCDREQLPAEGTLKAFIDTRPESHMALCVGVLEGVPYAVDNMCPHQRAPLSAGRLDGPYIVCPVHAWKFRLMDGAPHRSGDPVLPAYELRVYGSEVFVRVPGEPARMQERCLVTEEASNGHCHLLPFSAIR